MLSKALEWAYVSIGTLGNMEGCSFLKAFEIKGYIKMLCKQVSLSIGALLWNL
jgi:hypothetical protein